MTNNNIDNQELIRLASIVQRFNAAAGQLARKDPAIAPALETAATLEDRQKAAELMGTLFEEMQNLDENATEEEADVTFARNLLPLAEHTAAVVAKAGLSAKFAGLLPNEAKNTKTAQSFTSAGAPSIAHMIYICLQ